MDFKVNMKLHADDPMPDKKSAIFSKIGSFEIKKQAAKPQENAMMDYYDQDITNQNLNNIRLYLVRCISHFSTKLAQLERMHDSNSKDSNGLDMKQYRSKSSNNLFENNIQNKMPSSIIPNCMLIDIPKYNGWSFP